MNFNTPGMEQLLKQAAGYGKSAQAAPRVLPEWAEDPAAPKVTPTAAPAVPAQAPVVTDTSTNKVPAATSAPSTNNTDVVTDTTTGVDKVTGEGGTDNPLVPDKAKPEEVKPFHERLQLWYANATKDPEQRHKIHSIMAAVAGGGIGAFLASQRSRDKDERGGIIGPALMSALLFGGGMYAFGRGKDDLTDADAKRKAQEAADLAKANEGPPTVIGDLTRRGGEHLRRNAVGYAGGATSAVASAPWWEAIGRGMSDAKGTGTKGGWSRFRHAIKDPTHWRDAKTGPIRGMAKPALLMMLALAGNHGFKRIVDNWRAKADKANKDKG